MNQNVKKLEDCTAYLNEYISEFTKIYDNIEQSGLYDDKIRDVGKSVENYYDLVLQNIDNLINFVSKQSSSSNNDKPISIQDGEIPDQQVIKRLLDDFFKGDSILKKKDPFLGFQAYRNKAPSPAQFVCAKQNDEANKIQFVLMIVLSHNKQTNTISVFDPCDRDPQKIELTESEYVLLPYVFPEKPHFKYEHKQSDKVLALWLDERTNDWTSVFYPATVKERPKAREGDNTRCYTLEFEETSKDVAYSVPEAFVAYFHKEWQEEYARM